MTRIPTAHELEKFGIYKRFAGVTFGAIEAKGVPDMIARQYRQVKGYRDNLDDNIRNGVGMIMLGPVGTMKTTLAVAVLREQIERNKSGYFIPMVSLLDMINESDRRKYSERPTITLEDRIRQTPLLVLDDLGAEYDHAWVQAKVDAIITERYNRMRSTIITTNLNRNDIKDRYQARIFDRLRASSELVSFVGHSLRTTAGMDL